MSNYTNQPEKNAVNSNFSNNGGSKPSSSDQLGFLGEMADPRQYLDVIRQYWWLILLILLLGTGLGVAYSTFATKLYRASCRYELFRESRLNLAEDYAAHQGTSIEDELSRQVVIMTSGSLNNRVIERLRSAWESQIGEDNLRPKINIDRVRQTNTMVDISVDAVDEDYALDYLEAMLLVYREMRREEILDSSDRALENLRREHTDIGRELDVANDALTEFRQRHNLIYTQTKSWYDEQFLANLVQRENSLLMQQTILASQFEFLETADVATIQDALSLTMETQIAAQDLSNISPSLSGMTTAEMAAQSEIGQHLGSAGMSEMKQLQWGEDLDWQRQETALHRLQGEYQENKTIYKEDHPKMIELERDIAAAKRDLKLAAEIALKRLRARFVALDLQLDAVREAAQTWRHELELTTAERTEHARLHSKVDHLKKLHERVYTRILDGAVVDVDALFSRLVEPARVYPEPVWPAKAKIMILAVILSLGVGGAGAFGLDYLDTRFQDILVIEERLNIPYLSGIPNWLRVSKTYRRKNDPILVGKAGDESSIETYRALRDSIEQALNYQGSFALALTSGEAGEGKTMTTLNTAILFARSGKKVLLIDSDFRRGTCHKAFDIDRQPGLCELLAGELESWEELVRETDTDGLHFIASGQFSQDIPETLSTSRINGLIKEWKQQYDIIIFDTAPAGHIVDTAIIARACDGVLLVVRHGQASVASVKHALHRLGKANIIGFCLNSIDLGHHSVGYYKRYGKMPYGRYAYPYEAYYSAYDEPTKDKKAKVESTG